MGYYRDIREHIDVLDKRGKLVRVTEPFCKDTEIHPLVRWQFRGLAEAQRRAFLFENVHDAKGRSYTSPVLVGGLAASRDIFSLAMQIPADQLMEKLSAAQRNLIKPCVVDAGPCQEEVHLGAELLDEGGLEEFPIPVSTPGYDIAPYTSYSHWVTRDPESGIHNVGNYRGQLKSPTRMGIFATFPQHLAMHWDKCKARGIPLEAALVLGATPNVTFAANTKVPYDVDEYDVAGAVAGEPLELVRCKTVDLLVPATAEVVVEGRISTEVVEPEAPFGETTGYMGQEVLSWVFEVTCITHRRKPIWTSLISQFPPSESTKLRQLSFEPVFYKYLRHDCNIPSVTDVAFHESCSSYYFCAIQMKKTNPAQAWQALNAAVAYDSGVGKVFVVVDEDVDPRDADAINWAICSRVQPHRDVRIREGRTVIMDFSAVHPNESSLGSDKLYPPPNGASALVIDATRKWAYPPTSLPKREYMERARQRWEALGLPALEVKNPWHGYELGYWPEEHAQFARWAVDGNYRKVGEIQQQRQRKVNLGGQPVEDGAP